MLSLALDANQAGRITVGRWTLDLHKNSLRMPATITLQVDSDDATDVHVVVVPAEANDFKVPVELFASVADLPGTDFDTAWMWYREGEVWEPCEEVAAHPNQQNVVARMQVLSDCRLGERPVGGDAAETESAKAKNK
jgi:hypothetical protein